MRKVFIYRNELLNLSETFILSQANALNRFQPVFTGVRRIKPSLDLEHHPITLVSDSDAWQEKTRRRIFLRTGRAHRFLNASSEHHAQIIHAHFAIDASAILPIAKHLQLPLIVTLHGYDVSCDEEEFSSLPTTRAYLRRKKDLWQYASLFLCVSEHVRQRALEKGFPSEKLWVHRIGTSVEENISEDSVHRKPVILFVGRLVSKKGCIYLIHAMPRILQKIPDAQLVIIGDGPLRNALEKEAYSWRERITFLGHLSHAEVKQWMREARVLAVPSIRAANGDEEGLPTVLCEAQALRLPVAAFAGGGVMEALPEERHATMPLQGDEVGLANEIVRLMTDDKAWHRASISGRQYVNNYCNLERQTRILEDKYDEIIAEYCD